MKKPKRARVRRPQARQCRTDTLTVKPRYSMTIGGNTLEEYTRDAFLFIGNMISGMGGCGERGSIDRHLGGVMNALVDVCIRKATQCAKPYPLYGPILSAATELTRLIEYFAKQDIVGLRKYTSHNLELPVLVSRNASKEQRLRIKSLIEHTRLGVSLHGTFEHGASVRTKSNRFALHAVNGWIYVAGRPVTLPWRYKPELTPSGTFKKEKVALKMWSDAIMKELDAILEAIARPHKYDDSIVYGRDLPRVAAILAKRQDEENQMGVRGEVSRIMETLPSPAKAIAGSPWTSRMCVALLDELVNASGKHFADKMANATVSKSIRKDVKDWMENALERIAPAIGARGRTPAS